jgi:hypothetical protein
VRDTGPDDGGHAGGDRAGDRHQHLATAAGRLRDHHAVQLSRDDPPVVLALRRGHRQHGGAQAQRTGPAHASADRAAGRGGGPPAGRAQRRARGPGGGGGRLRPPRDRRRLVRGLEPRGAGGLHPCIGGREAGPDARRGQEPPDRPSRRRHGRGGGCVHGIHLRLHRAAMPGGECRARSGRGPRGHPRAAPRRRGLAPGRRWPRARDRNGTGDLRGAPGPGRGLHPPRGGRGGPPHPGRTRSAGARKGGRVLGGPDRLRGCLSRHGGGVGGDLRSRGRSEPGLQRGRGSATTCSPPCSTCTRRPSS